MNFPAFDPVIFRLGPLAVRWYGLMYLLGFLSGYFIIRALARQRRLPLDADGISDLLFYAVLGVVLGGRLGYVCFYQPAFYLQHPLQILSVWEGGMSFHGGFLGVIIAGTIFCRRRRVSLLLTADIVATASTVGLGLGRVGNFINAELWGRTTNVPWGVIFPGGGPLPRHPSQLYEGLLEGPLLLGALLLLHRRQAKPGVPFFVFFVLYGTIRFCVEFFRQPDAHLGYLWGGASMGQLLSLPMIVVGLGGVYWVMRRREDAGD
ncbi:MAG: prolipoprotein diacylglyceryl transferase [Desulfuromonadales bacterium GWC2_61_20]|nr:MAG: prolipoprotein diacylglyceryl transferase [Desulfuromonadales bacterium GWC2_61_20]